MSKDFMTLLHGLLVMACRLYVGHGCYTFASLCLKRSLPVNKSDDMWDLRQRGDEVVLLYEGGPFPSHESSQSECMSWISLGNVDSRVIRGHPRPDDARFIPWIRTCVIIPVADVVFIMPQRLGPGYSSEGEPYDFRLPKIQGGAEISRAHTSKRIANMGILTWTSFFNSNDF
jgi:hypothetical protein